MTLLLIALIAGVLTILTPCVLPLLPVIVGGSVSGKMSLKKAGIVTASLGVSVIAFTLLLKASTLLIAIPESVWMWLSGGILIVFGLITLLPALWERVSLATKLTSESNKLLAVGYSKQNIWGDVLIGAALGPVFSSCSPTYFLVLATVLPQRPAAGLIDLMAYATGLCAALLLVAIGGQRIVRKLGMASNPNGWFKRSLGILFVLVGLAIGGGIDQTVETGLLNSGVFDITKVEQALLQHRTPTARNVGDTSTAAAPSRSGNPQQQRTMGTGSPANDSVHEQARRAAKSQKYQLAPEITDPAGFINTGGQPITIRQFRGQKVVLLDIWTYSCINCQRTLPYVKAWYDTYASQGLEIIGIHTPEFSFEKVPKNVEAAVARFGIRYPVVLDNDYGTWNAFGNEYWPRKYLIDIDGYVVYDHTGEGDYDETERAIQKALAERQSLLGAPDSISTAITLPKDAIPFDGSLIGSPETYFGFDRNEYLGSGNRFTPGVQILSVPATVEPNTLYLGGTWYFDKEYAQNAGPAKIVYRYTARSVYLVASAQNGVKISVLRDGKPLGSAAGTDVDSDSTALIQQDRLYMIVEGSDYGEHTLEIEIENPGLHAFTFTFG
jgi:cytochrome c biogenesis protein CcdA/thiol-disulfide isomerase/thioredoxin